MGPGQYRINFLHHQANPNIGGLTPAGPGYEMTCVNNPGAVPVDWQFPFDPDEIVTTEILAFDL
jgi:hypothetical protein